METFCKQRCETESILRTPRITCVYSWHSSNAGCPIAVVLQPCECVNVQPELDPKLIGLRATSKWVREFKYFRATATGELATFMDYVS